MAFPVSNKTSKVDEEEKKDQVVRLEDIMDLVYEMKFGKQGKKRSFYDMEGGPSSKNVLKRSNTDLLNDEEKSHNQSQLSYRSKSYKDGEEVLSEDSYLFQWKPDYIQRNESYWDSKQERFACVKGSSGLGYRVAMT